MTTTTTNCTMQKNGVPRTVVVTLSLLLVFLACMLLSPRLFISEYGACLEDGSLYRSKRHKFCQYKPTDERCVDNDDEVEALRCVTAVWRGEFIGRKPTPVECKGCSSGGGHFRGGFPFHW